MFVNCGIVFPVFIGFVVSQFFWGITVVGMLSLIQARSMEQIHPSYAPVALGYITVYFAMGQLLGSGLGNRIIDHIGGISTALLAFLFSLRLQKNEDGQSL